MEGGGELGIKEEDKDAGTGGGPPPERGEAAEDCCLEEGCNVKRGGDAEGAAVAVVDDEVDAAEVDEDDEEEEDEDEDEFGMRVMDFGSEEVIVKTGGGPVLLLLLLEVFGDGEGGRAVFAAVAVVAFGDDPGAGFAPRAGEPRGVLAPLSLPDPCGCGFAEPGLLSVEPAK